MDSNPQILECNFTDFDELTEAIQGWELELNKLEIGSFKGRLFQLMDSQIILTHAFFSSRLLQEGAPPPGFKTFVVPADPEFRMLWRGQPITGSDLIVFPDGSELHALSMPNFNAISLSISVKLLQETAAQLGVAGIEPDVTGREVIPCSPSAMAEMRSILFDLEKNSACHPFASRRVAYSLVHLLANGKSGHKSNLQKTAGRQRKLILDSERLIHQNPEELISVQHLCEHAQVSKRNLEYAFHQQLGIAPKRFIMSVRLNRVRKALRSGKEAKVVDTANFWGFWHMGQFAKDYRKLFGELPSETLKYSGIGI